MLAGGPLCYKHSRVFSRVRNSIIPFRRQEKINRPLFATSQAHFHGYSIFSLFPGVSFILSAMSDTNYSRFGEKLDVIVLSFPGGLGSVNDCSDSCMVPVYANVKTSVKH